MPDRLELSRYFKKCAHCGQLGDAFTAGASTFCKVCGRDVDG